MLNIHFWGMSCKQTLKKLQCLFLTKSIKIFEAVFCQKLETDFLGVLTVY